MLLKPKNWSIFQHYKDRSPPWIKLHRDTLNDRKFMCLPTASKALAPMMWLLASESKDGSFDASPEELHFRLRMDEKEIKIGLKALIDNGFFVIVDSVLADCYHIAIPETERETERETKKETEKKRAPRFDAVQHLVSLGVFEQVARDYCQQRKKKPTMTAIEGIYKQAQKAGISLNNALEICCARGWEGFKAEWITENRNDKRTEHQKRQDATARALLGDAYYATPTMKAIEGEVIHEEPPFTHRLG